MSDPLNMDNCKKQRSECENTQEEKGDADLKINRKTKTNRFLKQFLICLKNVIILSWENSFRLMIKRSLSHFIFWSHF